MHCNASRAQQGHCHHVPGAVLLIQPAFPSQWDSTERLGSLHHSHPTPQHRMSATVRWMLVVRKAAPRVLPYPPSPQQRDVAWGVACPLSMSSSSYSSASERGSPLVLGRGSHSVLRVVVRVTLGEDFRAQGGRWPERHITSLNISRKRVDIRL